MIRIVCLLCLRRVRSLLSLPHLNEAYSKHLVSPESFEQVVNNSSPDALENREASEEEQEEDLNKEEVVQQPSIFQEPIQSIMVSKQVSSPGSLTPSHRSFKQSRLLQGNMEALAVLSEDSPQTQQHRQWLEEQVKILTVENNLLKKKVQNFEHER